MGNMTLEEKEFIEDFDPSRLREAAQTRTEDRERLIELVVTITITSYRAVSGYVPS